MKGAALSKISSSKALLEKDIKEAVKKRLREIGAYQHWPVQTGIGTVCLDCHACYHGLYVAIETKAPGKKLTPQQAYTVAAIEKAKGIVIVVDSLEQAAKLLEAECKLVEKIKSPCPPLFQ